MTALYIAGYALGAAVTWVLWVRDVARRFPSLGWRGGNFAASLFFAAWWPAVLPILLLLAMRRPDWDAPGTRLFNYFKRRG